MKGKTHSTEEIIRILRQGDGGNTAQSVCREHNISEQTYYRWKKKYGDMELADAKRLKELEKVGCCAYSAAAAVLGAKGVHLP